MRQARFSSMQVEDTLFIAEKGCASAAVAGSTGMVHDTQVPADWQERYHILVYGLEQDAIRPGDETRFAEERAAMGLPAFAGKATSQAGGAALQHDFLPQHEAENKVY